MKGLHVCALVFAALALGAPRSSHAGARSAELLWQSLASGVEGSADLLAASASRVFAAGEVADAVQSNVLIRAHAAHSGALLWEKGIAGPGAGAYQGALVAQGPRVFVAAILASPSTDLDWFAAGYDARTGALLWQDVLDEGGTEEAHEALVHGQQLVVAGLAGEALLVRAYDKRTGALAWESRPAGWGGVAAMARAGESIIIVGRGVARSFAVGALDAATGELRWEDHIQEEESRASDVVVAGGVAFVSGAVGGVARVGAYDAASGDAKWEWTRTSSEPSATNRLALANGRVFASGAVNTTTGSHRLLVALDAGSGHVEWQRQSCCGVLHDVDATPTRVFVAGWSGEFLVEAYDPATGDLLWEDHVPPSGSSSTSSSAVSILAGGSAVYAGGGLGEPSGDSFGVRAYALTPARVPGRAIVEGFRGRALRASRP